jgi:hypothetical protein
MKNVYKTLILTAIISIIAVSFAFYVQFTGKSAVIEGCSYLDPITIDILAFLVAVFLVVEGIFKIFINSNVPLKGQVTRSIRVAVGLAIITIHIMQFAYK